MYKTIIVEDEADVREAIIATIDWESHGFSIAGQAGNGQEAMELMEQLTPDLVITDIKMPFMDGIALATAIREINPVTKIVFLSGFNEFDYAISALKLNVIEYILKPVSHQELSGALHSIREKLDEEQNRANDLTLLQEQFNRQRVILKNSFLISLIKGSPSEGEIGSKVDKYGLSLKGECFLLFTMSIDRTSIPDSRIQTDDLELLLLSAVGVAGRLGEKYVQAEDFIYDENVIVLLSDTPENIQKYADILISEVRQYIRKYCGFSVTIGVSRPFSSLTQAPEAYADSISAIHYRLVEGGDRIIYISDFERSDYFLSEAQGARFHSLVKTGTQEEVSDFLTQLFGELKARSASLRSYQMCIMELFSLLLKAAKTAQDPDVNIRESLGYMAELHKQNSVEEILAWFQGLCHQVMGILGEQRRDSVELLAERAVDYIQENYADSELSLKSLSDALHVSASYLSTVIKRAKNEPFTNLLTRVRMEKAYELLASTNQSIQEIAEQTGYSDRHYFSYCFKKFYDSSPVQMRNRQKAEREKDESDVS